MENAVTFTTSSCRKCKLGPVQKSNYTCAESNANEQEQ